VNALALEGDEGRG